MKAENKTTAPHKQMGMAGRNYQYLYNNMHEKAHFLHR